MNKWLELLIGLILVVIPIWVLIAVPYFQSWGVATIAFLKGGVVVFLVLVGLLFLMLGISDLKS